MNKVEERDVTGNWWLLTLRGVSAILFGIAAVFWPGLTLGILVYLFSAYILVNGMITLIEGIASIGSKQTWVLSILLGIAELAVGVYLVRNPLVSFGVLILLIGFTFIVSAVTEAMKALIDKSLNSTAKVLTFISAGLSLIVGVIILTQPASGGVAFVWVLGLIALISGPVSIAMSLDLRKQHEAMVAAA